MPDTLSQGGDREPSRRPRRVAALAVLVLAAVLIVVHLPRSQQPRALPDRAAASVRPSAVPSAAVASEAVEPAVAAPNGITGPVLSWPGGLRLVTNGQRPAWFWPGTGQTVGTWLSSDALISFGWPASSDSLVAELGFTTKVQVISWRPGAARLAVAALRLRQGPASLVIGQYAP